MLRRRERSPQVEGAVTRGPTSGVFGGSVGPDHPSFCLVRGTVRCRSSLPVAAALLPLIIVDAVLIRTRTNILMTHIVVVMLQFTRTYGHQSILAQ